MTLVKFTMLYSMKTSGDLILPFFKRGILRNLPFFTSHAIKNMEPEFYPAYFIQLFSVNNLLCVNCSFTDLPVGHVACR